MSAGATFVNIQASLCPLLEFVDICWGGPMQMPRRCCHSQCQMQRSSSAGMRSLHATGEHASMIALLVRCSLARTICASIAEEFAVLQSSTTCGLLAPAQLCTNDTHEIFVTLMWVTWQPLHSLTQKRSSEAHHAMQTSHLHSMHLAVVASIRSGSMPGHGTCKSCLSSCHLLQQDRQGDPCRQPCYCGTAASFPSHGI